MESLSTNLINSKNDSHLIYTPPTFPTRTFDSYSCKPK